MSNAPAPASRPKKWLTGCAIVAVVVGLLGFLGLVGLAFWSQARSDAADAAGKAFCAQVQPGDAVATVTARAEADPARPNVTPWQDQLVVTYVGGWMHAATCRIEVADGKVTQAELQIAND
jgi:predicted lipid-binding transport protein (Tim44 family)